MKSSERLKKLSTKKENLGVDYGMGVSSGCTMLNLALTGRANVAYLPGKYYLVVGDSTSGKTILMMSCLAEASINRKWDDAWLVYDNAEDGALMDVRRLFGACLSLRMTAPSENGCSRTLEEFFYNITRLLKSGQRGIYILDSLDALFPEVDEEHFEQNREAYYDGKKAKGSYDMTKPKMISSNMRIVRNQLERSGSILLSVSQARDNVGSFSFEKNTRSGGRAPKFYATGELWLSNKGRIKRTVRGKDWPIGIQSKISVKKNRVTGQEHTVEMPIYWSRGIDDTGSMINWMLDVGIWTKKNSKIQASELDMIGSVEELCQQIEEENKEKQLRLAVMDAWTDIIAACQIARKPRY